MNGMDAVIQIRNSAVKGFSIYADKSRGCAERLPLRASPDAFHSTLKIRKREVVPVNQGLLCCANLFAAARGVRIAQRVGWVERSDTHQVPPRHDDGFRKSLTHPTGYPSYALENGAYSMGYISHRDIADAIRAPLSADKPPTDEMIAEFDAYMRGPGTGP